MNLPNGSIWILYYYSDYDLEGKYNPVPLVEKTIIPEDERQTYEFLIEDQDFRR